MIWTGPNKLDFVICTIPYMSIQQEHPIWRNLTKRQEVVVIQKCFYSTSSMNKEVEFEQPRLTEGEKIQTTICPSENI